MNNMAISENNKKTNFGTRFSPKLQEALIEAANRSLMTQEHLKYIRKIKNDGLPTLLDLKPYYNPGQEEIIISSPNIDKLRNAKNITPRGRSVCAYNKSRMSYHLDYQELAKAFSPKSALALNIKWAEEDAIYLLNVIKQKKMEKATPDNIRKIFNA
jgi:hypothetical protein